MKWKRKDAQTRKERHEKKKKKERIANDVVRI